MSFADLAAPPVEAHQNLHEFGKLWDLVAMWPHARVLEIGSLYGGTLWYWMQLPEIDTLVTVDLPPDHPSTPAHVRDGCRAARREWSKWAGQTPSLRFLIDLQSDSHDPVIIEQVRRLGPFDFMFIDGSHDYPGVRADWDNYSLMLSPGALVAFHDTWPNGTRHEPGVVTLCHELRHEMGSVEFTDPDGVGICVFFTP